MFVARIQSPHNATSMGNTEMIRTTVLYMHMQSIHAHICIAVMSVREKAKGMTEAEFLYDVEHIDIYTYSIHTV